MSLRFRAIQQLGYRTKTFGEIKNVHRVAPIFKISKFNVVRAFTDDHPPSSHGDNENTFTEHRRLQYHHFSDEIKAREQQKGNDFVIWAVGTMLSIWLLQALWDYKTSPKYRVDRKHMEKLYAEDSVSLRQPVGGGWNEEEIKAAYPDPKCQQCFDANSYYRYARYKHPLERLDSEIKNYQKRTGITMKEHHDRLCHHCNNKLGYSNTVVHSWLVHSIHTAYGAHIIDPKYGLKDQTQTLPPTPDYIKQNWENTNEWKNAATVYGE